MNAIPDPVEFKPESKGATPAERTTFEVISRIEKAQRAQRGDFLVRMRAQEEKLAGVFGELVGDLLAPRDQTTAKLLQDSEAQKRQITACENRQADGRAVLERRLDDVSSRQQARDAVIDDRLDNLMRQVVALEGRHADARAEFATQLADANAAAEHRSTAMQAECEQRVDDVADRLQARDAVIDGRLNNLMRQVAALENRHADARADFATQLADTKATAEQRFTVMQTECEQCLDDVSERQQTRDAVIDDRLDSLMRQLTALEDRYADAGVEFAIQLADVKAAAEQRVTALQADCERRLAAQQAAHDKAMAELRTAQADLCTKNAELDDVIIDLGEQLQALTQANTALQAQLEARSAAFDERLDDVSGQQQARDAALNDRFDNLISQVVVFEHRHANAWTEFETQLVDATAVAEQRLRAMQAECEQRSAAQQVANDKVIAELRTAHADLQTKNAELDDVVVDLGEQLQALTQANTAAECEQRLAAQQVAHDQAMAELRTAHAGLQTKNDELDDVVVDLGERLQALTQANTAAECDQRLAAQQAAHDRTIAELQMAHADLRAKNAELDDAVVALGERLETLRQANTALQTQCEARGAAFDERLTQSQRDTSAELTKAVRNVDALLADNIGMRRELEQAKDVTAALRESELHHERAAALRDEAKRGPTGLKGAKGDKGDTGCAGRNGKDGVTTTITKTVATKRWEIDRRAYTVREVKTNGERGPAIPMRSLFEQFRDDMDL